MEELLPWIGRLLVVLVVIRLFRMLVTPAAKARRPPGPPPAREGGKLVRDPQCGTYVPMASAVRVTAGRDTLYFCSTTCRDAYRASHSSVA